MLYSDTSFITSSTGARRCDTCSNLDVWEGYFTYVEDDHIREAALGGPDTCSRAKVAWQVKVLLRPVAATTTTFDCNSLDALLPLGTGKLRARARLDKPSTELCVIPPESRYRGAENQLYRVEVHKGGEATNDATGATFKWSRENGSVTFPIRWPSGNGDCQASCRLAG